MSATPEAPSRNPETEAETMTCECGHDTRMHVVGASPRYAGCMVVLEWATEYRRKRYCPCSEPPVRTGQ